MTLHIITNRSLTAGVCAGALAFTLSLVSSPIQAQQAPAAPQGQQPAGRAGGQAPAPAPAGRGAQPGGRGGAPAAAQAPQTPRARVSAELTGTWVPLITEDWRFRMVTPPRGDVASVPISPEGRKVAESWDPAKDAAANEQCKAYGAAGIMRMPLRIRMSWDNDTTLKLETDSGQQTRLFQFGPSTPPAGEPGWQGYSVATLETMGDAQGVAGGGGGGGGRGGGAGQGPPLSGGIKVVTTRMRPGYLRRNGVPYSAQAVMTEYLDAFRDANGETYLIVSTTVEDPQYLAQPFVTSTHFKKEPDNSKWAPRPCEITPPVERTAR